MLHMDYTRFNNTNLIKLTWKAEVSEYDIAPTRSNPFRLRIQFNRAGFMRKGAGYPYCYVSPMVMNLGHSFSDDAYVETNQFSTESMLTNWAWTQTSTESSDELPNDITPFQHDCA